MNKIASVVNEFKLGWEQRVGSNSEFDKQLTPESRQYSRLMLNEPCVATDAILNGIGITSGDVNRCPNVNNPIKFAGIASLAATTTVASIVSYSCCQCFHSSWWVTILALGIITFLTACAMCYRQGRLRKHISVNVPESCVPQLTIDPKTMPFVLDSFQRMVENVVARVKDQEKDRALGFDATDSTGFGEWVQAFVDFANENTDNNDLRLLKCALVSQLRMMGIVVYDAILTKADGTLNLPDRESFKDERPSDDVEFTKVRRAVVYSRRRVLAYGELA